jgi:type I restriction enzyme R subunit
MIGYVERHEHAIDKKTEIMIEHFEEKIAPLIYGKAKAMIVTKSRLHAVRYKIAFDKYLAKK